MFEDFDFSILDDPEFKEDSVREELVVPIISALGYKAVGDARIIRGRRLVHPFVALGSQRKTVSIIPDYVFLVDEKPYWVLDAKSPQEKIINSKHVEQAYSYAIHPEIRARLYGLCNGKEFVLFSVSQFRPLLKVCVKDINEHWGLLARLLDPKITANPDVVNYDPDYGMHLKSLGAREGFKYISCFVNTDHFVKVEDGLYTTSTIVSFEDDYAMTLDFGEDIFEQLLSILPMHQSKMLREGLKRQPYAVELNNNDEFKFGAVSVLTDQECANNEESYFPFKVSNVFPYGDEQRLEQA
jgi:hypothetical protein